MARSATSRLKCNPPLGRMPVLQFVQPDELAIDAAYQRSIETGPSQSLIRKIAQHWNWEPASVHVLCRRQVGAEFAVSDEQMMSRSRTGVIAQTRQAAMYVLRHRFGLSYPCVAKAVGRGDHSTAIFAVRQTENRMARSPEFAARIRALVRGRVIKHYDRHVVSYHAHLDAERKRAIAARPRHWDRALADAGASIQLKRRVKPKNELDDDDFDAVLRSTGSDKLSARIAAVGGWPKEPVMGGAA